MVLEIDTPHGPARAHVEAAPEPRGTLMLGHGAGGSIDAPDLRLTAAVAADLGWTVVLVEQPYRVAGKKAAAPAPKLDEAWLAVVARLRADGIVGPGPLVAGGRSSGARVACRTAAEAGAAGVLCLAFPLHPPGKPEKTRLPELEAVEVPVLIVQGERDPFGRPPAAPGREVVVVAGDHGLKADRDAVRAAVREWLSGR